MENEATEPTQGEKQGGVADVPPLSSPGASVLVTATRMRTQLACMNQAYFLSPLKLVQIGFLPLVPSRGLPKAALRCCFVYTIQPIHLSGTLLP